jgi:hypothetical protein
MAFERRGVRLVPRAAQQQQRLRFGATRRRAPRHATGAAATGTNGERCVRARLLVDAFGGEPQQACRLDAIDAITLIPGGRAHRLESIHGLITLCQSN